MSFSVFVEVAELISFRYSVSSRDAVIALNLSRFTDFLFADAQYIHEFVNLREVLHNSGPLIAEVLFEPVIDRSSESQGAVAADNPDLAAKWQFLTTCLAQLLDPHPPEVSWDADEFDVSHGITFGQRRG